MSNLAKPGFFLCKGLLPFVCEYVKDSRLKVVIVNPSIYKAYSKIEIKVALRPRVQQRPKDKYKVQERHNRHHSGCTIEIIHSRKT